MTLTQNRDLQLTALQPGDTLVIWRLDRLGRSLPRLLATVGVAGSGRRYHSGVEHMF